MSKLILQPPVPRLDSEYQPGVTDPIWPAEAPAGADPTVYRDQYAGQLDRQRHLHIITADVSVRSRPELAELLKRLTSFAKHQMAKLPVYDGIRKYDERAESRRVTVTIGFGATLFTTADGDDRFGLAGRKPTWLKVIPNTEGDAPTFVPRDHATDLVVLAASDDFYVNEYIFGRLYYGSVHAGIKVRRVERGYARPDNREPSGFEDGLTNPRDTPHDYPMHHFVYIHEGDDEPEWCVNGTYLAYRKVGRQLTRFFSLNDADREAVFGAKRKTGKRLRHASPSAHSPKMNPRRPNADLFGVKDESRRFLRRPYFFTDGLDATGDEVRGLHHLSFVRNLGYQYEWPVHMWQMNRDFPRPNTGLDTLYEMGGAANVGGGYFFVPAAAAADDDYVGSALLV